MLADVWIVLESPLWPCQAIDSYIKFDPGQVKLGYISDHLYDCDYVVKIVEMDCDDIANAKTFDGSWNDFAVTGHISKHSFVTARQNLTFSLL